MFLFSSLTSFSLPNHCESLLTYSLCAVFISYMHLLCYLLVQASPCPAVGSPSQGYPLVPPVYFIVSFCAVLREQMHVLFSCPCPLRSKLNNYKWLCLKHVLVCFFYYCHITPWVGKTFVVIILLVQIKLA